MKANELRIGNWVKVNDPIFGVNTYKVATIRNNGIITLSDNISCSIDNIEPIELTEEVLLKIGFKNVFQSKVTKAKIVLNEEISDNEFNEVTVVFFNSGCSYLHINIRRDKSGRDDTLIIRDIKYLHQLQNAYYCLTNQELEIKL